MVNVSKLYHLICIYKHLSIFLVFVTTTDSPFSSAFLHLSLLYLPVALRCLLLANLFCLLLFDLLLNIPFSCDFYHLSLSHYPHHLLLIDLLLNIPFSCDLHHLSPDLYPHLLDRARIHNTISISQLLGPHLHNLFFML